MKKVSTLPEAMEFFLSEHAGSVTCIDAAGNEKECSCYPEAAAFYTESELQPKPPVREQGWYWVKSKPSGAIKEAYWSVMEWDGCSSWLISGREWPTYLDSDLLEINPNRIKEPTEAWSVKASGDDLIISHADNSYVVVKREGNDRIAADILARMAIDLIGEPEEEK
ncbi:hypothetical protein K6U51_12220 [Vibrio fluvialis]|uniref:hypothetical protein n=1 Tax=Vibrio fluvialis TaxID=676 RepID=UPI001EEA285A|nr:hypothetical protein [Vibrio fluvialis]MCG6387557.1 hypothetical protein [Vibrio fluvialis]MCG6418801.1 hypothetical protein [Vibrio fluvialis]